VTGSPTVAVTSSGASVAGAVTVSGATVTFTPASPLAYGATITATVSGAEGSGGTAPARSWSFTVVTDPEQPTPVTLFGAADPGASVGVDGTSVELGTVFSSSVAGQVTALRFYKTAGDTAAHTGTLWGPTGLALTTVTFSGESASGWQTAALASPVTLTAGTNYTVSFLSPQGRYPYVTGYFASPRSSGPLTATNGTYRYGTGGVMPASSWQSSSYFADVVFTAGTTSTPAPSVASKAPTGTSVATTAAITATLSQDVTAPSLSVSAGGANVAGTSLYGAATRTLTFTPSTALAAATAYTVTVTIGGQTLDQWTFTTAAPEVPGSVETLFGTVTPATAASTDTAAVELGTAFTVAKAGSVTAIRFYKGSGNTGTHVGSLWSATGQRLATVTFTGETASGWQRAALSDPVALSPGSTYVVSYLAPAGRYAIEAGYFATARTSGSITAPATSNGRFLYGAAGGFPTGSWNASSYFVDAEVTFGAVTTPTPTPTSVVTAVTPAGGGTDIAPTTTIAATFDIAASGAVLTVTKGAATVPGVSAYDPDTHVVAFTPTDPLEWSAAYTVRVTIAGAAATGGEWTFTTTSAPPVLAAQTIFGDATPQNGAWNDPKSVQVATRFTVSAPGQATSVRFYKGDANTGDHTGYLWRADGVLLGQVSFFGETASGWQDAVFAQPIDLQPGVEYRVGLHSTTGRYAVDLNGLAQPMTAGALSTPANGAAYTYSQAFPDNLSSHNYWVDVTFAPRE